MKNILAFDTALSGVSVGFVSRETKLISRQVDTARGQATLLIPVIDEVLTEAGCDYKDLDLIVSTVGPGSFTGLRIGLCTARVLALSLEKPVITMTTLDMMARQYFKAHQCALDGKALLIVFETKRQDFYAGYYNDKGERLGEPFAANASEVLKAQQDNEVIVAGDCLERFKSEAGERGSDLQYLPEINKIDSVQMALHGSYLFDNERENNSSVEPLYLRDADITPPKNLPRKLATSS